MRLFEATAGDVGLTASRRALESSGIDAADITHLISISCTGFASPGFDFELCEQLQLKHSIARTNIGFMGCHAMLNGLRVADAFVKSDARAIVLICAVELCSLHYQYGRDVGRIVANSLFADGAAAMICRRLPSQQAGNHWKLRASGSQLIPAGKELMTWKVGDHGFEMTLSRQVPNWIRQRLRSWLVPWLAEHGFKLEEIRQWAIHPGGPRILDAIEESLGLTPQDTLPSRQTLERYGNMSSPTVVFVLERLRHGTSRGGCVMLGFGPGLTIEAAILV
jgi:predicted naringenin-chalcone synthase